MKRLVALAVFLVASAVAAGVAFADHGGRGHGGKHHGKTVSVIEHATTDAVTNEGNGSGDVVGDILTFTNDVFDKSNSRKVGTDQGYCVRMIVGESWECVWTTLLPRGQITVEGPFYDAADSELAITGGTGEYAEASGSLALHARNDKGSEYDFVYSLK